MDVLQRSFDGLIDGASQKFLSKLLERKLGAVGIRWSKAKRDLLAGEILGGKTDELTIDLGGKRGSTSVSLEFTEEGTKWIEDRFKEFSDGLPEMYAELSKKLSGTILRSLKRKWREERVRQRRDEEGFRRRLLRRWGRGLDRLRMLITISREFGSDINERVRTSGNVARPRTFDVLVRLHARSCQVAEEIVCLLEGGFADGAMARWRTLHEIAAVCHFLHEHGEDVAERYEAHQVVESYKAAMQHNRVHVRLKRKAVPQKEMNQLKAAYDACLEKYGKDFKNNQGWASKQLGKENPTIADIQEACGIDHLGPYYRMASHNVHANPKGIYFKLGVIGEINGLLAGASNAGMADPGHSTAISLIQIAATLMDFEMTLDSQVMVRVMQALEEEIGKELLAAHRKLNLDNGRLRSRGRPGGGRVGADVPSRARNRVTQQ